MTRTTSLVLLLERFFAHEQHGAPAPFTVDGNGAQIDIARHACDKASTISIKTQIDDSGPTYCCRNSAMGVPPV